MRGWGRADAGNLFRERVRWRGGIDFAGCGVVSFRIEGGMARWNGAVQWDRPTVREADLFG
ncbi:MAG: hypothetical protein Q4C47_09690 [Planctomycetia bacterium]|nr:hypothetical protein [Planctomycetia bacterium]